MSGRASHEKQKHLWRKIRTLVNTACHTTDTLEVYTLISADEIQFAYSAIMVRLTEVERVRYKHFFPYLSTSSKSHGRENMKMTIFNIFFMQSCTYSESHDSFYGVDVWKYYIT